MHRTTHLVLQLLMATVLLVSSSYHSSSVIVEKSVEAPQLFLAEPSVLLEAFRVSDSDNGWDNSDPLTVSIETTQSIVGHANLTESQLLKDSDPIRLSLASTQDLYFSGANGAGSGVNDVRSSFNAYNDRVASEAISSIKLQLPDNFDVPIDVEYNSN